MLDPVVIREREIGAENRHRPQIFSARCKERMRCGHELSPGLDRRLACTAHILIAKVLTRLPGYPARLPQEAAGTGGLTMIEGGCLCGAARYKADAEPLTMRACWCRLCQYIAAGNAAIGLAFPRAAVTISGEFARLCHHRRQRQPHAPAVLPELRRPSVQRGGGTPASRSSSGPAHWTTRVSSRPTAVIWTSQAPKWAKIDPACVQFEGQPPPVG